MARLAETAAVPLDAKRGALAKACTAMSKAKGKGKAKAKAASTKTKAKTMAKAKQPSSPKAAKPKGEVKASPKAAPKNEDGVSMTAKCIKSREYHGAARKAKADGKTRKNKTHWLAMLSLQLPCFVPKRVGNDLCQDL